MKPDFTLEVVHFSLPLSYFTGKISLFWYLSLPEILLGENRQHRNLSVESEFKCLCLATATVVFCQSFLASGYSSMRSWSANQDSRILKNIFSVTIHLCDSTCIYQHQMESTLLTLFPYSRYEVHKTFSLQY